MSKSISNQETTDINKTSQLQGKQESKLKDRKILFKSFKEFLCKCTFFGRFLKSLDGRTVEMVDVNTPINGRLSSLVDNAKKEILNLWRCA
jgi:hypothetical protein